MLAVGDMVKSSPGPKSHTCQDDNYRLPFIYLVGERGIVKETCQDDMAMP